MEGEGEKGNGSSRDFGSTSGWEAIFRSEMKPRAVFRNGTVEGMKLDKRVSLRNAGKGRKGEWVGWSGGGGLGE